MSASTGQESMRRSSVDDRAGERTGRRASSVTRTRSRHHVEHNGPSDRAEPSSRRSASRTSAPRAKRRDRLVRSGQRRRLKRETFTALSPRSKLLHPRPQQALYTPDPRLRRTLSTAEPATRGASRWRVPSGNSYPATVSEEGGTCRSTQPFRSMTYTCRTNRTAATKPPYAGAQRRT